MIDCRTSIHGCRFVSEIIFAILRLVVKVRLVFARLLVDVNIVTPANLHRVLGSPTVVRRN